MRLRRGLLVTAIVLLVIALSVVLVNIFFFGRIRQNAESILSGVMTAPVSIRSLSFDLFKGIVLKDLTVTVSNRPAVHLAGFSLKFRLSDLLKGTLTFEKTGVNGLEILVSDATNDFLPYYKNLLGKFNPGFSKTETRMTSPHGAAVGVEKKGGPKLPVKLSIQSVKGRDLGVTFDGRRYGLDSLGAVLGPDRLTLDISVKDFQGLAGLKAGITRFTNGFCSFRLDYVVLDRKIRAFADRGSIQGHFTNTDRIIATNLSLGQDLSLSVCGAVCVSRQTIDLTAGRNTLVYKDKTLRFSGGIRDFSKFLVRARVEADDLPVGLALKSADGSVKLSADIEGSLKTAKGPRLVITRGQAFSERISLAGILSNGLELRNLKVTVRDNMLTQASCLASSGGLSARVKARTTDFFLKPVSIFVDAEADDFSLEKLKFVRKAASAPAEGNPGSGQRKFVIDAKAHVGNFQLASYELKDAAASAVLMPDESWQGQCSFLVDAAKVQGRFDAGARGASFDATVAGFDVSRFIPDVVSSMGADVSGTYDAAAGKLSLSADISDDRISYKGLSLTAFKGHLALNGDRIEMTNGQASFFGGGISHSMSYDLKQARGVIRLDGRGIDVKSLYHLLVPDPGSEFTGKAGLDLEVTIGPEKRVWTSGKVTLTKGIIQDTKLQKQISSALLVPENQCVNYVLYDTIGLDFGYDGSVVAINDFSVVSSDLEFQLKGDYSLKEKRKGKLAMDLLISDICKQDLPNPHQFVISVISRRNIQWSLIRFLWLNGETKLVKPEK